MTQSFAENRQGWFYFIIKDNETANPVWPITPAGAGASTEPIGSNHKAVSATAPATAITGVSKKLILRAINFLNVSTMNVELRQADGSTAYFDGIEFSAGAGINAFRGPFHIPLHNGLCAIVTSAPGAGNGGCIVCYEIVGY